MDFTLSEEQRQLAQSVVRFVVRDYSFDKREAGQSEAIGFSELHWQRIVELGWLAASFPREVGGLGGSAIESMLICEQFGRALVLEPFLPMQLAGHILLENQSSSLALQLLPNLLQGQLKIATALYEPSSRFELDAIETLATPRESGFRLNGTKTPVLFAHVAEKIIVSAKLVEEGEQKQEIALFVLDNHCKGITLTPFQTIDGQQAALLKLENCDVNAANILCRGTSVCTKLEQAIDAALIGYCAEALGAMDQLLDMTVDYTRQRTQFGQPVSRLQALQHKMTDMYIDCQAVRSLLYTAAIKSAEKSSDASRAIAALKFTVAEKGRSLAEQAVQLHGAVGFTDELPLGHYYKRLVAIAALFGDADFYLQRYAKLGELQ